MSNIGSKIEKLISDGFSYNTLRGLSEGQINLLYKRLVEARPFQTSGVEYTPDEVKQMATKGLSMPGGKEVKPTQQGGLIVTNEEDVNEDSDTLNIVDDPDATEDGMGMMETEIQEKFESKSQQKFFWAKCNNTKSPKAKKKWCKWAKEYSEKTPDFDKLPEKKEKDVKEIEEGLTKLVEKYIPESITKGKLMSMIEQASAPAKPKEKEKTTTKPSIRPGKQNPFTKPGPLPGPKAGGGTQTAPSKPTTKPTTKPGVKPGKQNPFTKPGPLPGPKAGKTPEWLSYNTFISQGFSLK